ncbi:hypothetical protein DMENIID0001_066670 [Sergentomyia squamirostris]
MKFQIVVLVAFVGVVCGNPVSNFKKDIDEIVAVLPLEEMKNIAEDYYNTDSEIQDIVAYLKGDEAKKIYAEIVALKDVQEFIGFLGEQGLNTERFSSLETLLRLPTYEPDASKAKVLRTGGLKGLIADIKACLPQNDLQRILMRKLTKSPGFASVYKKIQEFNFLPLEEYANQSKEVAALVKRLESYGINVDKVVKQLTALFGWSKSASDSDDFDME